MPPLTAPELELRAIVDGSAVADLAGFRKVLVAGPDARRWLHDLVTADVASLAVGGSRRSLLLDATGHVRADLQISCADDGFWLLQAPDQPADIGTVLAPYVLSAAVELSDRTEACSLVATFAADAADGAEAPADAPTSVVGVLAAPLVPGDRGARLPEGRTPVGADAIEVHRIRRGRPRMGPDFDETSIPAAARLTSLIDLEKGCFLGQESVARVRNLGHPPSVLVRGWTEADVEPGSEVSHEGETAGRVTSAAAAGGGGTALLATVGWRSRTASLRSSAGDPIVPVPWPD
jgi:folate-binding protein YgfZ